MAGELDVFLKLDRVIRNPLIGKVIAEARYAISAEHESDAVVPVDVILFRSGRNIYLGDLLAVLLGFLLPFLGCNLPYRGEKRLIEEMGHSGAVGRGDLEDLAHAELVEVGDG